MTSLQPLENEHVKNLDQPSENVIFHRTFVDQVKKARNSVFGDICMETCVPEYSDIRLKNLLAKRSVTKEKLASWLETVCCILDEYAISGLDEAALVSEEVESLKNEKISDERSIISLQSQLTEKHEDGVKSVQSKVSPK